MYLIHI